MSGFVLCIDNRSNPASLIVGKVYRLLPDAEAEGYLYPAALFVPIELPEAARQALLAAETTTP